MKMFSIALIVFLVQISCKTTGPLFTQKDIERLAHVFRLKPSRSLRNIYGIDEDNDYVLQQVPCPFFD